VVVWVSSLCLIAPPSVIKVVVKLYSGAKQGLVALTQYAGCSNLLQFPLVFMNVLFPMSSVLTVKVDTN